MNQQMFSHPAVQRNLATLQADGCQIIGPDSGDQACGDFGLGRMTEPDEIVQALNASLAHTTAGPMAGQTLMITTGPTREAIDPVRYISNHSSGLQGLAIAEAGRRAGAKVILIAGPGVDPSHGDITRFNVTSAQEMYDSVHEHLPKTDLFIGVAAVADYRPATAQQQKIKRHAQAEDQVQLPQLKTQTLSPQWFKPNRPRSLLASPRKPTTLCKCSRKTGAQKPRCDRGQRRL